MHDIGIVVLAAGKSQRMGRPKQLLKIGEKSLIQHVIQIVESTPYAPTVVVLGNEFEKIKKEIDGFDVIPVLNPDFEKGMGTSISKGIFEIQKRAPNLKAVFILLVDQPFLNANVLYQIEMLFQKDTKKIVASKYGETFGAPALFDQSMFKELESTGGEKGAKKLINKYLESGEAVFVDFPEGRFDLDTPEDYEQWLKNMDKNAL